MKGLGFDYKYKDGQNNKAFCIVFPPEFVSKQKYLAQIVERAFGKDHVFDVSKKEWDDIKL